MSERKTPIDMMLDSVEWRAVERTDEPDPDGLPYATHTGTLMIGEISLRCYQLNTGQRLLNAEDVQAFFGGVILRDDERTPDPAASPEESA